MRLGQAQAILPLKKVRQLVYLTRLESNYSERLMGRTGAQNATVAAGHKQPFFFLKQGRLGQAAPTHT